MARGSGGGNNRSLMAFLAFIAVILIGVSLAIGFIFDRLVIQIGGVDLVWLINHVAVVLGAIVAMYYSYGYVRNRSKGLFITWIIAVIVILVFVVLSFGAPFWWPR